MTEGGSLMLAETAWRPSATSCDPAVPAVMARLKSDIPHMRPADRDAGHGAASWRPARGAP